MLHSGFSADFLQKISPIVLNNVYCISPCSRHYKAGFLDLNIWISQFVNLDILDISGY